jgi:hemerythrin superfamily protein
VEWLIKQLYTYELVDKNVHPNNLIFQKAKEMEKEQKQSALKLIEAQNQYIALLCKEIDSAVSIGLSFS